jgi:hypothetical protein
MLALVALAIGCGSGGAAKQPSKDGLACWTCDDFEAGAPDPSVQLEVTPEEAAASVHGVWQGEYSGEPFAEPLQIRITIEPAAGSSARYSLPHARGDECEVPPDAIGYCAERGFRAPASVEVIAGIADLGLETDYVSVHGTTWREAPYSSAEGVRGEFPDGVVLITQDPIREDPGINYLFSSDDTLWIKVFNHPENPGADPVVQIGQRLQE